MVGICIIIDFFAALTVIFAKIGVKGIDPDLATAIRTIVILFVAWGIVIAKGSLPGINTFSKNTIVFLVLSGLATGLSWIFYFKALQIGKVSQVAVVDKMSLVIVVFLSSILLNEVITWQTIAGTSLIITGSVILIL